MFDPKPVNVRLALRGTLEYRNARGEVIKTVELTIPLGKHLTKEQAREIVQQLENKTHGTDDRH